MPGIENLLAQVVTEHRSEVDAGNFRAEREAESPVPLGRTGQPDDIADIPVFLASNDSRRLTGEQFLASGGIR